MFQWLTDLVSASLWAYPAIVGIAALDALVPLVPSETAVITAGVLASSHDLSFPLVVVAGAAGAVAGDNAAFAIGRLAGKRPDGWIYRGKRGRAMRWGQHQLEHRGGFIIVIGRFIPGGRTAVTLGSGAVGMPWRRFIVFDVIAGSLWSLYAAGLGFVGGKAFERQPWKGLVLAFGIAGGIALVVEGWRFFRRRRVHGQEEPRA